MITRTNICLFDMDGTLCDFAASMDAQLKELQSHFEPAELNPNKKYRWLKARMSLIKRQEGFWTHLSPIKIGFDILAIAILLDFENYILTQGPKTTNIAWLEKKIWCDNYVPGIKVNISQEKSLVYGNVLVDDWPNFFLPWLEAHPLGLAVAVAQPWNKGVTHSRLIRCDGTNLEEVRARMSLAKN